MLFYIEAKQAISKIRDIIVIHLWNLFRRRILPSNIHVMPGWGQYAFMLKYIMDPITAEPTVILSELFYTELLQFLHEINIAFCLNIEEYFFQFNNIEEK